MSMEQSKRLLEEFPPNSYEEWTVVAEASLKGKPLEKISTKTYEGITLKPIYRKEDAENLPHLKNNFPGEFPYVRGTKADGYKKDAWLIEQEINNSCPGQFNATLQNDLKRGQNAISLKINEQVIDQLIQGKSDKFCPSTAVFDLKRLSKAFDGIDITKNFLHIKSNKYPAIFYSLFLAYLKQNNIKLSDIKGIFKIDPLGNLVRYGEINMKSETYYKWAAEIIKHLTENNSPLKAIEIDVSIYNDGGANALQEVAFALATAADYLRGISANGVEIKDIAKRVAFTVSVSSNHFMEISKMRALRMLWAFISKEFGADECGQKIFMHARTAKINKAELDQYVNMLRVTNESLAAVISGADSITVTPFDSLFGEPKDFSRRIARNTSLFLKEECNLLDTIDPAGGSWYIENITAEIANRAFKLFQEIEANGGMEKEILAGNIQKMVKEIKNQRVKNLQTRKDVLIGINKYPNTNEKEVDVINEDQQEFFDHIKEKYVKNEEIFANVDKKDMAKSITDMADAFAKGGFVMDAVNLFCNFSGIKAEKIDTTRLAEPFEIIRNNTKLAKEKNGKAPEIFLANMGPLKQFKPRADFSSDFFTTAGFDIIYNNGFNTPEEAAKAALESDSKVIVICSTDDTYPEIVPTLAKEIKTKNPDKYIILAGYPTDYIEQFKQAGVDEFIHIKSNIYDILSLIQTKLGIA